MRRPPLPTGPAATALVLWLLAGCGGGGPMGRAIEGLGGSESERRRAAMELKLSSEDPAPVLAEVIGDSGRPTRVRREAARVLGDILARRPAREQTGVETLIEHLQPGHPVSLRVAAAEALGLIGTEEALPALLPLRDAEPEPLREAALAAVRAIADAAVERIRRSAMTYTEQIRAHEALEAMGLDRGRVAYSKARLLEHRGMQEEADATYDRLGVIRRYWLLGTFPNRYGSGHQAVWPPETNARPRQPVSTGVRTLRWYRVQQDLRGGRLDFEPYFVETDRATAYALTYAVSDRARPAEIRLGSDDSIKLFVNGEPALSRNVNRGVSFDEDVVPIHLRKGVNTLLFKVSDEWGSWGLLARLTGPQDTPLAGVRITLDPPPDFESGQ